MDSNRTTVLENTVEEKVTAENRYEDIIEFDTPAYKPRKKRFQRIFLHLLTPMEELLYME